MSYINLRFTYLLTYLLNGSVRRPPMIGQYLHTHIHTHAHARTHAHRYIKTKSRPVWIMKIFISP